MEKNQCHGRRKSSKVPLQFFFIPIVLRRRSKISQRDLSCLFSWSNYYHLHLCLSLPSFNISPSSLSLSFFLSLSFLAALVVNLLWLRWFTLTFTSLFSFFCLFCVSHRVIYSMQHVQTCSFDIFFHTLLLAHVHPHTHSLSHAHCHSWLLVKDFCGFTYNVNLWSHNWNVQGQFLLIRFSMPRPVSKIVLLRLKLPWQWL